MKILNNYLVILEKRHDFPDTSLFVNLYETDKGWFLEIQNQKVWYNGRTLKKITKKEAEKLIFSS